MDICVYMMLVMNHHVVGVGLKLFIGCCLLFCSLYRDDPTLLQYHCGLSCGEANPCLTVFHCVFGINFMLKIEASVSQMVSKWDQNLIKLSRFHNSINFDKIRSTAG